MARIAHGALTLLFALLTALPAAAQSIPQTYGTGPRQLPKPVPLDPPIVPQAPTVVVAPSPVPAAPPVPVANPPLMPIPEEPSLFRLRFGVTVGAQLASIEGTFGALGAGLRVRAGVMIGEHFAVMYQAGGAIVREVDLRLIRHSDRTTPLRNIGFHTSSLLLELTPGERFQIRGGGTIVTGGGDRPSNGDPILGAGGTVVLSWRFAELDVAEGRNGVALSIQFDALEMHEADTTARLMFGLGWELY